MRPPPVSLSFQVTGRVWRYVSSPFLRCGTNCHLMMAILLGEVSWKSGYSSHERSRLLQPPPSGAEEPAAARRHRHEE